MPFSTITSARDAVFTLFKTAWDLQGSPPDVIYQDVQDDPPNNVNSWVRITMIHNEGRQVTLGESGSRRFRRFGFVTVQIFTKAGDGLTTNDTLTKVAIDAFEGNSTGGGDTIDFGLIVTGKQIQIS